MAMFLTYFENEIEREREKERYAGLNNIYIV